MNTLQQKYKELIALLERQEFTLSNNTNDKYNELRSQIAELEATYLLSMSNIDDISIDDIHVPLKPKKSYKIKGIVIQNKIAELEAKAIDIKKVPGFDSNEEWEAFMNGHSVEAKEELCADEIRGILWKHSDSSDEPENSWIDKDKFETIIAELKSLQFKQEPKI